MSRYQLNILLVDDNEQEYRTINSLLAEIKSWQCHLEHVPTYALAVEKLQQVEPDICLLNPNLPESNGLNHLDQIFEHQAATSLILLTEPNASDPGAVTNNGMVDYLSKNELDVNSLQRSFHYALQYKKLATSFEERIEERLLDLATENRQLQEKLIQWQHQAAVSQEREGLYQDLFNVDIYGVEVLDVQGNITDSNETYQQMLGYEREEMVGRHSTDFASVKGKVLLNKNLSLVKKQGYAEGEIELTHKDGSTLLVWRRLRATYDHNNQYMGAVSYSRDITERMKAVRQISNLARALEQSPVAILITDANGTIEYLNFKFTELTGYSYEEAVGENLRFVKSVDQSPDTFNELWQTITAGEEWQGEFHNITKEGEAYWEELTIAPMFNPQGAVTHFAVVQEDITDRKNVEAEAMHSQQRVGTLMTEQISDLTEANERLQREIGERKRMEKELRRGRARLKAQYKGIPVPTYSWQKSGMDLLLVDYNDVAEQESQGRIADFLGKSVREVFKDNEQVITDFENCLQGETTVTREAPYQLVTTGEIKHYVTTYNFVPPHLVVVHIQDVTEYKQAVETLKTYQTQLEPETNADSAVELSKKLTKVEEALQKETEQRQALEATLAKAQAKLDQQATDPPEAIAELKQTLQQEIAKRQQLEHALQESEEKFHEIAGNIDDRLREQYRSIPIPTYSWQRIAGEFILIDFNDAAAEAMGRIVDFFGKSVSEIFKDRPEILADFERCYQEKAKVVREAPYELITTGETRYFVTTYNFVPPNLVIDHIQDITEQRQMEADLEKYRGEYSEYSDKLSQLEAQVQQENEKRQQAEQALQQLQQQIGTHHDELEDVVRERTVELTEANKQLQREIFEHQRAEESLREARVRLRAQYKGIPIPTYSWRKVGRDFVLIDYNHAAEKSTQGSIAQFMSKTAREIFQDPKVLGDFSRCYDEKRSIRRESPYQLVTTGEMRYFITTYNFAPPNLIIVYIEDATALKQLESAFQECVEQIELECRFAPDGKVTFVNDAYCWYFNENRDNLMGQILPYVSDIDRRRVQHYLSTLNQQEPVKSIEYQVERPSAKGLIYWQRWIMRAIFDEQGRLVEYRSKGKDISRRKETGA